MKKPIVQAAAIGQIAKQALDAASVFQTAGASSRGIYLQSPEALILYLTREPFRSPLTITIPGSAQELPATSAGEPIRSTGDGLLFQGSSVAVSLRGAQVWEPPSPPTYLELSKERLRQAASQAVSLRPDHPWAGLLEFATGAGQAPLRDLPGLEKQLYRLADLWAGGSLADLGPGLSGILGAGPGLTPLGDDLLVGITLAAKRAKMPLGGSEAGFGQSLLQAAKQNTTALSWSLLSCSLQGSADERILRVADGLIAGREIPDQDLDDLLNWGSSSGMAVLAGMFLALWSRD